MTTKSSTSGTAPATSRSYGSAKNSTRNSCNYPRTTDGPPASSPPPTSSSHTTTPAHHKRPHSSPEEPPHDSLRQSTSECSRTPQTTTKQLGSQPLFNKQVRARGEARS